MILLDSNIVIYLHDPRYAEFFAEKLRSKALATCNVVVTEVLGYSGLTKADEKHFRDLFASMKNYSFDASVVEAVILFRKNTRIELPDAIIAATAIANDLTLWTHNTEDFQHITDLKLFNPLAL